MTLLQFNLDKAALIEVNKNVTYKGGAPDGCFTVGNTYNVAKVNKNNLIIVYNDFGKPCLMPLCYFN